MTTVSIWHWLIVLVVFLVPIIGVVTAGRRGVLGRKAYAMRVGSLFLLGVVLGVLLRTSVRRLRRLFFRLLIILGDFLLLLILFPFTESDLRLRGELLHRQGGISLEKNSFILGKFIVLKTGT